jgi:hypothetical protein
MRLFLLVDVNTMESVCITLVCRPLHAPLSDPLHERSVIISLLSRRSLSTYSIHEARDTHKGAKEAYFRASAAKSGLLPRYRLSGCMVRFEH